jgi:hypothetical protein
MESDRETTTGDASNLPARISSPDPIQQSEKTLRDELSIHDRVPVRAPPPLKISGRLLVCTFLLPWDASIDRDTESLWVSRFGNTLDT